jgi:hypothetical protein
MAFGKLLVVTALLSGLIVVASAKWDPPAFCNGLDCPRFDVIAECNTTAPFEVRRYPAQQWVSWSTQGPSYDGIGNQAFYHLFNYISGANALELKINMTAPVLTRIDSGAGPNCNSTFTVSFFIPYALQGLAPEPSAPDVFLQTLPETFVAVRAFGGYADSWELEVLPQLIALAEAVGNGSLPIVNSTESVAGYNAPYDIFNRHNEVALVIAANSTSQISC